MNTVEQSLGSISSLLISARELATALADGTYDETARGGAAVEARTLLEQMLQAGNMQSEGRYLFSGHLTRNQAFLSTPSGVVFQGDRGVIYSQVETSSQVATNLIGSDVLLGNIRTLGEGFDLNRGVTNGLLLTDLHQGTGVSLGMGMIRFVDNNLATSVAVDISGAASIGDVISAVNAQLIAGGMNGVTAQISPDGQSLRLVAQDNGLISAATRLSDINGGAAVDLVPGTFHLNTDDGSIDVEIDLSGATTIGAAISAFNTQMAAAGVNNVTLAVNAAQTGLRIVDANAGPLGLKIEDTVGGSTAHDLGLLGYINDELIGSDLNPQRKRSGGDRRARSRYSGVLHRNQRRLGP
jgi:flagellin-like hook-associated protein FlgL